MKTGALLLFAVATAVATPALAHAEDSRTFDDTKSGFLAPEVVLSLGVRGMIIPTRGYDPYGTNDLLLQSSFSAGVSFLRTRRFALSASFEWDAGGKSATTRGQEIDLFVHRLAIPIEGRWEATRRVSLFVKAAPGADRLLVSMDPSVRARAWAFGLDTTGGAAFMLGKARSARFWLTAEIGYAFTFSAAMKLETQPGPDDPPRHYGATALPDLALGGGLGRLGAAVSF